MNNIKGFSLVELMVAVGIVGTISAVAVPKYQVHKVKASQSEVKSNLSSVYTLQQLYYTDNDRYGKASEIKFKPGIGSKYWYGVRTAKISNINVIADGSLDTSDLADQTGDTNGHVFFKAVARAKEVLGSCSKEDGGSLNTDKWCVNHEKWLGNSGTVEAPCLAGDIEDGGCE